MNKYSTLKNVLKSGINDFKLTGTYKNERIISSPQKNLIIANNKEVLNFCSNNYLGLCDHPEIKKTAINSIQERGFGLSSVRFICGTTDKHKDLENTITNFHKTEDTILFPSCFDANAAIFEALLTSEDAVISDELNHASIIDGIRLCKAKRFRFKHMNMEHLEQCLEEAKNSRIKLVVTDAVFSMDGDIAPLDKIVKLCEKHNAIIMVDECHSTGLFGETGRGIVELYNATDHVEIINSTLGKAMGGANGGFTTGKKEIIEMLRQKGRPYLFSNSLPTNAVEAYKRAFELLKESKSLISNLNRNVKLFRTEMAKAGFEISGHHENPISPVMLYDAKITGEISDLLLDEGIYVVGFSFPVVPKEKARIRVQLSAVHTEENVWKCINSFVKIGKAKGVI